MISARPLALSLVLFSSGTACRETAQAKAAELRSIETARKQQFARRVAAVDAGPNKDAPIAQWIMPPELREISGLALTKNGTVLAHDDEVSRITEIDPRTGVILRRFALEGARHGDFEAITMAGSDVYLLESDGKIFRFKMGEDGTEVPYTLFNTGLGKECEFESMAFEPDSSRLLLACKKSKQKGDHDLTIYGLALPLGKSETPSMMTVALKDVVGDNKWKSFRASDLAIDPVTHNYVLVSSKDRGLVVITPDGEVVKSVPLPPGHNQAEGVAITTDDLLLISDESNHAPAAVTVYRWHR
jgi:uncharacterized protein YjiK